MIVAEQLVGEARERRQRSMSHLERIVYAISAIAFVATAVSIAAFMPDERPSDALLACALMAGYAIVSRVRFEFGWGYVTPEHLVFIPMLLLLPLPWVPFFVVGGTLLAQLPDFVDRSWHRDRWVGVFPDSWFCIGPVLVLGALAPGTADFSMVGVYALAFAAQVLFDFSWGAISARVLDHLAGKYPVPLVEIWHNYVGVIRFDGLLTPVAIAIAILAVQEPLALLAIGPLVLMLESFARERSDRYSKALELQRAYRGTVMLLTDVVESEDSYTADHSRSVVELVNAVADEMNVDARDRLELEFAAMLHDVGKIAIPKEILNKPAKLTDAEFTVMKQHTIEGQHMLDRVGGLLGTVGEIVRSCHERWDGGGYPDGLAGEQIPLAARIVFTCDAYNAMTTDRVYRAALPVEEALRELEVNAGTQFDPRVVAALTRVVERSDPQPFTAADDVRAVLAADSAITAQRVGAAV
ncbi:MAG TPA: HD-GYP domain-containing protein [Thermoleophilaceae bacterium]|nr:HD-GYP domain-containing protein [Thermoleophilaceae bacterium]